MNSTNFLDVIFFHFVQTDIQLFDKVCPDYFANDTIKDLFVIVQKHIQEYKTVPTKEQVGSMVELSGKGGVITPDNINTIYVAKDQLSGYDPVWLKDTVVAWIKFKALDKCMRQALSYIKTTNVNTENVSEVTDKVKDIVVRGTSIQFDNGTGSNFFNASDHSQERLDRHTTGYPYIDKCQKGGNWAGSLIVYAAGPKTGKSFWLCNLAASSALQGRNVAYVTLELQEELVLARIGSNLLHIPLDQYEEFSRDTSAVQQKLKDFKLGYMGKIGTIHVKEYPSSTASVNDIETYLLKYQEDNNMKFDDVYIDYINIMRNSKNPNSENTYLKLKCICEDARAMGQNNKWTVVSVTQLNRSNIDASDFTMTALSESIAVAHTVDMLYGIISSAESKIGGYYYLKCICDRVAPMENTKKKFLMNWTYGRITEDLSTDIEDMDISNTVTNNGNNFHRGPGYIKSNQTSPLPPPNYRRRSDISKELDERAAISTREMVNSIVETHPQTENINLMNNVPPSSLIGKGGPSTSTDIDDGDVYDELESSTVSSPGSLFANINVTGLEAFGIQTKHN